MSAFFNTFAVMSVVSVIIFIAVFAVIIGVFISIIKRSRISRFMGPVRSFDNFDDRPRSLSGRDLHLLPKIRRDFPDFNVTQAKTAVKDELKKMLDGKFELRIHNVVISDYLVTELEKTVVFQAALSYVDEVFPVQKRYEIHYSFLLADGVSAANCPNCGAPVTDVSALCCEYCDSRLVNVTDNHWRFTEIYEK